MKRIVFIVLVTLGWLQANAQREPVLDRKSIGYTVTEVRTQLIFATGVKPKSWRSKLIENVNVKLEQAGKPLRLTENNLPLYINDANVTYEERTLLAKGFLNSGWNSRTQIVEMYESTQSFIGDAAIFHYEDLNIELWKFDCVNLLSVPLVIISSPKPQLARATNTPAQKAEGGDDWTKQIRGSALYSSSQNYYAGSTTQINSNNRYLSFNIGVNVNGFGGGRYTNNTPQFVIRPNQQQYQPVDADLFTVSGNGNPSDPSTFLVNPTNSLKDASMFIVH